MGSVTQPHLATGRDSDAELVERAGRGEARAFEAIMRRHNRLLFRSARGIVDDDAEAQDVVQEAYLRAFSTLPSFRGDCALGTWMARIAINIARDTQRKQGRTLRFDDMAAHDDAPDREEMMFLSAHASSSPDAQVESGQMRALLQLAIDSLPPKYRSVLILRSVQEMSVEETAACLELSADVVKTRYLRARSMMRDALGAHVEAHANDVYDFAGARCDAVVAHVIAESRRLGLISPDGQC